MEARILAQTEHPLWDELVSSSPYGSVFDESRWFTAVPDVFGRTVEVVGVFDDDRLAGGVVLECSKRCGLPVGALPPLCAALNNVNVASEEMTVEAALTGDRQLVYHAVACDPLTAAVLSLAEIEKLVKAMFKKNKGYLPGFDSKTRRGT